MHSVPSPPPSRQHPPPPSSAPPPSERETPQGSLNTSYKYHRARRARHRPAGLRLAAGEIICIVGGHTPGTTWAGARPPLPGGTVGGVAGRADHRSPESARAWWRVQVIPASQRLRQEDCREFQASLGYMPETRLYVYIYTHIYDLCVCIYICSYIFSIR